MNKIIPVFKSHYSVGKSVLTLDKETEITPNKPVSIFAIAKQHNLGSVLVVDENPSGFLEGYETFKDSGIKFCFGLSINVLKDAANQSPESCDSESKLWVIAKNTVGYYDLITLWNKFSIDRNKFYYHIRASFSDIFNNLTKNLILVIPPYDSFLHKNYLDWGLDIPDIPAGTIVTYADMDLFFNDELVKILKSYSVNNNLELQEVHPVYYYSEKYFKSWQTLRCIQERRSFDKPELNGCISTNFSFESFLEKQNARQ